MTFIFLKFSILQKQLAGDTQQKEGKSRENEIWSRNKKAKDLMPTIYINIYLYIKKAQSFPEQWKQYNGQLAWTVLKAVFGYSGCQLSYIHSQRVEMANSTSAGPSSVLHHEKKTWVDRDNATNIRDPDCTLENSSHFYPCLLPWTTDGEKQNCQAGFPLRCLLLPLPKRNEGTGCRANLDVAWKSHADVSYVDTLKHFPKKGWIKIYNKLFIKEKNKDIG